MQKTVHFFNNGGNYRVPVVVYKPSGFDPTQKYIVGVFLTGKGEWTDNPDNITAFERSTYHQGLLDCVDMLQVILVCPIFVPSANYTIEANGVIRQTWWPNYEGGYYMRDVFSWIYANLPVQGKLRLTGFSSGANGTLDSISDVLTANKIDRAAPVSGGRVSGDYSLVKTNNIPVWLFHGANDTDRDTATPASGAVQNEEMLSAITNGNPEVKLTLIPNTKHTDCPGKVYPTTEFRKWFFSLSTEEPEPEPTKKLLAKLYVSNLEVSVFDDKSTEVKEVII